MKPLHALVLLAWVAPLARGVLPTSPAMTAVSTISVLPILLESTVEPIHEEVPDAHGGFFLVWSDSSAISGARLFGKHFDVHGQTVGTFKETLLVPQVESAQDWIAFPDGWGGLALAWVAGGQLSVRRFSEGLDPVIHAIVLSRELPKRPSGVEGGGGALDLVWSEDQNDSQHILKAQRIDAEGRIIWAEGGVPFSRGASLETRAEIQSDNAGGLIIAWYDVREDKNVSRMKIQRLSIAGQPLWGAYARTVVAPVYNLRRPPALEALGEGRVVVGWLAPEANAMRFFTQAFELTGDPVSAEAPRPVSAFPINNSESLLYGDDRGNVWVAWTDNRSDQTWAVLLKKLPPSGEAVWRKPAQFSDYAENQRYPALATDGREGIFGLWIGDRLGKQTIYAQHLDEDGDAQWGEYGRAVASVQHAHPVRFKALAEGLALAIWSDELKKGQWTLNAALLDAGPEETSSASASKQ
jgi:hypothetical protein